jgi:putative redox protein
VTVTETRASTFQNLVVAGHHRLLADEPEEVGGTDTGPSPYDYLSIALAACTSMTLRMYANHKKIPLGRVAVAVRHGKMPVDHCEDCGEVAEGREGRIDRFERAISIEGGTPPELADKIVEIAGKCPVHRTLEAGSAVVTRLVESETDD